MDRQAANDTRQASNAVTLEHQAIAAVFGAAFAAAAVWAVHYAVTTYGLWSTAAAVDLWGWATFTFRSYGNMALLNAEWFSLFSIGYHHYLSALLLVGLAVWAVTFGSSTRRPVGKTVLWTACGALLGGVLGYLSPLVTEMGAFQAMLAQLGGMAFLGIFAGCIVEGARTDPIVRGSRVEDRSARASNPAKAARRAAKKGQIVLAGVPLPLSAETRHIVIPGATGTGKSTAILALLASAIGRGDRAVVADPDGTMLSRFYKSGDVVLNPFDRRCAKWDVFAEIRSDTDYATIAEALIPNVGTGDDEKWVRDGRTVLANAMRTYHKAELGTCDTFGAVLASGSTDQLAALCEDTPAARFFAEGNERMLGSVLATLSPASNVLLMMAQVSGEPFSIRRWVQEGQGRLWLPYQAAQVPALRTVLASWISIAMIETLNLRADESRKLWFVIDEADQLGRISALDLCLTKGRKYGARVVLGLQSIAQLQQHYGAAISKVINEQCGNRLILRCDTSEGGGTAQFASDLIGEREVAWEEETVSTSGHGAQRSTSVSRQKRRQIERTVLPSEIAQLPDRTGYLRVAGTDVWTKVAFGYADYPEVANQNEPPIADAAE